MNYKSVNLEICRAIINNKRVVCQQIDEETLIVIPNEGTYGYFLTINQSAFNFDRLKYIDTSKKQIFQPDVINPKNEIKPTDDFKYNRSRKHFIQKFIGEIRKGKRSEEKIAWINSTFLKPLDLSVCKFYQKFDDIRSAIIAVENDVPVMLIMPVQVMD